MAGPLFSDMPELTGQGLEDPRKYAGCMSEVRQRLGIITSTVDAIRNDGSQDLVRVETIFLQFRKVLELIAFCSLVANKDLYSKVHSNYHEHWNAKKLLQDLRKVNPEFFPVPIGEFIRTGERSGRFEPPTEPALSEEEFTTLYDRTNEALHVQNPFKPPQTIQLGYTVDEWVKRIIALVQWHYIKPVEHIRWMVNVPEDGHVHVYPSDRLEAPHMP